MRDQPGAIAGGSARAEFERRRARHQAKVKRSRPLALALALGGVIIGFLIMLFGQTWSLLGWAIVVAVPTMVIAALTLPSHVRAWDTGAEGEERTGALLAPLEREGYRVLHDRRIPGSRANIDHVVVGPTGVFVVETKSYSGSVRSKGGQLWVNGRRRTAIIDQAKCEASVVAAVLPGVVVTPLLCIHRADLPLVRRIELDGVQVVGPRGLTRCLRDGPALLSGEEVERLAAVLEARLQPAA